MKKNFLIATLFYLSSPFAFSQLILKTVETNRKVKIPVGSYITVKLPVSSQAPQDSCDCFNALSGEMSEVSKDKIDLTVEKTHRSFRDIDGVNKNIYTYLSYPKEKVASSLVLKNPISITTENKRIEAFKNLGGVLIVISLVQGLVINPFMTDNLRKTSTKIMWSTFGMGLTLALIPSKKTYHFQQPKNGKKVKLWQLATP